MYYTYIIQSINNPSKFYIGYTNSLSNRLIAHNHINNKGYTAKYMPWQIFHYFEFENKVDALRKEKWLKSGIGRTWFKNYFKLE